MIFKTNTDDFGRMGLEFNNSFKEMFNGDFFKEQNLLSDSDISAIKAYNAEIDKCVTSQTAFNRTMLNTSQQAQNVVAAANGNKVALEGMTKASKAAELGMKALSIAGNMIATMVVSWVLSEAISWLNDLAHAEENARKRSEELTSSYEDEKKNIDDSIAKYKELSEKLNDSSLSISEVKSIKEQLLSIQDQLNEKYGAEATQIDLVNGKYDEQIKKLDTLSKKKASDYVSENYKDIQADQKYVSEKFNVNKSLGFKGTQARPDDYSNAGFDLKKYLDRYDKLSAKVVSPDGQYGMTGDVNLVTNGTRQEVYHQLSQLFRDLSNDFGNSNEDVNKFKTTISGILEDSFDTDALDSANDRIKKYAQAEILSNDDASASYNNLIDAVDNYNTALSSGKGVDDAKKKLVEAKKAAEDSTKDITNSGEVLQDVYNSLSGKAPIEFQVEIGKDVDEKLKQSYENTVNRFLTNPKTSRAIDEAKENLSFEYQKISDYGLDDYADQIKNDTIQTKFGNVDMDKRTIIHWSDELKQTYKDELDSWDYDPKVGTIDTVYGMSDRFGEGFKGHEEGWEIAFTPILPDGTFLSKDTVEEYINQILAEAYADDGKVTDDELKELDAQGRQIGDTFVQGIYAGIDDSQNYDNNGNWAEVVGRLMHFAGFDGAVQIAEREIADLEKKYGEDGSQKIKDFLDTEGISTQKEIDYFNDVTKNAKTAEDAIKAYTDAKKASNKTPISFIDTLNSSEYKDVKEKLLNLAKSGEITPETLSSTQEYNALLEKVGISAESAKDQILDMLSVQERLAGTTQGLDKLKSAYEEFKNKDIGFVTAKTLESLPDVFKNLPEFDSFSKIAGNPESGKEKIQQAFNDIVKAYILDQETLQGLVGADSNTIQTYIANLKQMGVTNAEEVVRTASEVLNSDNKMINDAEKEYNEYLENKLKGGEEFLKSTASQNSILKNALGSTYQSDYNNWCDLLSKKAGAYNKFVDAIGGSYDDSKSVIQNMLDNGINISVSNLTDAYTAQAEYNRQVEEYKKLKDSLKVDLSPITTDFNVNYSSSSSSSSSNSDFDWIQVKLEAISRITDKLQKKFEKTFTVNSAAKKFKDYLSQINSEISANKTAGQTYLHYFNGVGLSSEWKNKIKSGKYKIDKNVDSATADKISEAQGYWNNYLQTLETIDQLEEERESAEDTYANKVIDHYNKQIEKQQKLLDLREKFVSIRATWSDFANTASDYRYEQSKNMEQIKTYDNAIAKYRSLQKTVAQGSDAWNTYNEQIKDNQDKIQELTLSNAELSKSIMNLPLDNASKKIEKYSNNLSLLQTKYNSLNMADSKNKNIDLQEKQSANIKAANDAALKEANANLNSAWTAVRTKAYDTFKTANKKAKKGDYLTQFSSTREGYKTIVDYNNALTAQKKAYEEAEKASAEYYRTVQENTKTKWDNIINQYQTNYDYFNSKSSRASAYLDYRKSMGYSNTSIYQEDAYKDQLQAQKDALAELETERSKLDWNKIQKQYEAGELQRDDYFALAKTIKELDSSIYKAKSDINETNATINKIPFQRLEYQIGTLTNKQTELSNALSLKQKLNEAIKAEDYTSQINTNKQLEKLYISENTWLQEQLETVSVNSDKWKEWTDAIASNESKINSLKQSNEDLKDSLRSEVYIKPFEKMATKIDFLKERLSSFLGLVNDTDTMFDDKGAFTKNGEAALGLSLKNIDAAKLKIENIQNKIQEAQKLYNNGNNDIGYSEEEYADDMRQYISDMWNAVSESKSASDEIVKIYQEQGQAILDALNKEIDARSEALQKKKEYYDYDKTIKTKTKDIQSLETQIAAMQSMEDSLEKRKKLLELQEELNEKQEDLKDTQLDHQINIVVNGLDDFSTKIQENFDDSVKELKTNLDKQAEIINKANSLYADSYNSIFEHLSKLMKYYGIDSSKLPSDLKDTTIGNLKGFSRGGVARDLSGIIKQNGDSLLASINPNETVLTERFTELMPHAVDIMEGLIKTPVIPPSSVMQPNVNIQFNVDGNVDSVTWDTIKKEIPNISKQVQRDIYVDLKKSGALRK